jgi:integrase
VNRKRLTETSVFNLPTRRVQYRVWDSGPNSARGLFILIQPSGTRTYHVLFRFKSSPKEHTLALGRVGEATLEEARDKALEARRKAARGDDPRVSDASDTFKAIVEKWTTNEQQGRKECVSAERTLTFVLSNTKRWHDRPIGSLRYGEIDDLLSAKRKSSPYACNRLHAHLMTMFRWTVRTKRIPVNPISDMPKPWLGEKPRQRDWFKGEKADGVIVALWRYADQVGGIHGKFIKLLVITGKRRVAVETMRWDHISSDWYWSPTLGSKGKRCHAIPLPKLAQRILSPRQDIGRVLDGNVSPAWMVLDVRKMIEVEDFIWHGCRHIVETKLGELKVPPHVRDMLLDHAPLRGSGGNYDHGTYRDECLAALELWCSHIEGLLASAENVRVLR